MLLKRLLSLWQSFCPPRRTSRSYVCQIGSESTVSHLGFCHCPTVEARGFAKARTFDGFEGDIFDVDQLQAARRSSEIRKTVLTYYRTQVVRPNLLEYDHQACREAPGKWLPGLQSSFQDLCRGRPAGNYPPCSFGPGRAANLWYRCWALLRVTGAWPVCLFENNGGLPLCLEKCPACDKREVLPLHALAECPATLCIWEEAAEILGLPARRQGLRLVAFYASTLIRG